MKGMRGARMNRAMKLIRKRPARKKTVPALALKGSGMGHDLSIMFRYENNDGCPKGQALQETTSSDSLEKAGNVFSYFSHAGGNPVFSSCSGLPLPDY
jgi:hypothetical protein